MNSDKNETSNTLNVMLNKTSYSYRIEKMNDMLYLMCCDSATVATCNFYIVPDRDEDSSDSEDV